MAAIPAIYLKLIGELILFVVILWATFSPEGIMSNMSVYVNSIEPCLIQNWVVTGVSVANWAPGEFGTSYKTLGSPHTIKLDTSAGWPALTVRAATQSIDTKYQCLSPKLVLPSGPCGVSPANIKLKSSKQTLAINKYVESNGCRVNLTVSG